MTDEYYVASAAESGWTSDSSNEYNKRMARSRRVLSKFNDEQKRTAWQNIKSTSIVLMGVNIIDRTVTRTFDRLQSVINKFTYAPLMEGLSEYTDQLTEFQAIVQNSAQWFDNIGGSEHIQAITDALDDLNSYADLTIYKFRDMQRSFTGFVNAGLTVEDSATMAKGIASWTAFMGKGAYDYASAAYMMNQALLAGKMQYYQWRSLEQFSQIGGMLPKKLFIETAKSLGKDAPDWEELANPYDEEETDQNFRDSLADDWLTSSVMLKAMDILANFGTEYDEAKLKAQGFSDEIINMAKTAFGESQKVRTYSQFMDAVIESIGTGWGQIFRSFLGDTTVATKMWTKLMLQVTGDIDGVVESVKKQAENFAKAGGRDAIEGILFNIWDIIKNITKSISNLFHIAIPGTNNLGASLANVAKNIEWFTGLLAGKNKIKNQFSFLGVLAVIFQKTASVAKRLFNVARKLWNEGLKPIFGAIGGVLIRFGPQVWAIIDKIVSAIELLGDKLIDSGLFKGIANIFTGASDAIDNGTSNGLVSFIESLLQNIGDAIKGINIDGILGAIVNISESLTGIMSGDGVSSLFGFLWIAIQMRIALKAISKVFKSTADIAKSFNGVEGSFRNIIGSIIAIVISISILSSIDTSQLWSACFKSILIGIALRVLGKGLGSIARNSSKILTLIPVMLVLAAIIGGLVYGLYKLKETGADLSELPDILRAIAKLLSGMAGLIGALAAVMFVLSTKSIAAKIIALKAQQNTDQMADVIGKIFKKGRLQFNFQLGDFVSKRMLAITTIILAISAFVKTIATLIEVLTDLVQDPEEFKQVLSGFLVIMGSLLMIVSIINLFSRSKEWDEFYSIRNGKNKRITKKSSQNIDFLRSTALLLLAISASIFIITKSIEVIGKMDENDVIMGFYVVMRILVALLGVFLAVQVVSRLLGPGKFDFRMLSSLIALEVILGNILGIAILCRWIGGWDIEKIKQGAEVVAVIAGALLLLMTYISILQGIMAYASNNTSIIKSMLSFALVLIGLSAVITSTTFLIVEILAVARYLGANQDQIDYFWQAIQIFGLIALIVLAMFGIIAVINHLSTTKNSLSSLASLLVLSVMLGQISLLMGELVLFANAPLTKMAYAAAIFAIVAAVVVGIYTAISLISSKSGSAFGKVMLSLLAVIVIIGVLSLVVSTLTTLMESGDGGKLIGMVGSIVLLIAAIAAIAVGLGILQTATMGIGAAALWVGIAALLAIAGVIWILSDASAKFMSATGDLADGINDLVDAFEAIGDINFKAFKSNLSKFLEAIESALPRIQKLAAAVGGIAGTLIIAGGDITIGAGSVSIPSGAVAGANVGINTASVNMGASGSQSQTSVADKAVQMAIPKEETIKEKVGGAVSGFFDGLFQAIGGALPNIGLGWVTGSSAMEQAMVDAGWKLGDIDTTGWSDDDVEKLNFVKKHQNDEGRRGADAMRYRSELEKKYPDSFKKKIEAPNAGIQSALDSIDNAALFESKYGWLDDKVLNGVSKNQLTNDLDNMYGDINDAIRANGTIDEATIKAIVEAYVRSSQYSDIYISGNMLGDITNRVLGQYIN